MGKNAGNQARSLIPGLIVSMSLRWLFLGGLLSSRARLRFANTVIMGERVGRLKASSQGENSM